MSKATRKVKMVRMTREDIEREMAELEEKFGMTTAEFARKYQAGELEHTTDFSFWAGLYGFYIEASKSRA
jgi:hypothetical protein